MRITISDSTRSFEKGNTVLDCLRGFDPKMEETALGAFFGGRVLGLNERLIEDCALVPITFEEDEGRRIYERSLRLLLIAALGVVFPGSRLRVDYSIGYGVYMKLLDRAVSDGDVMQLEMAMWGLCEEDCPYTIKEGTVSLKDVTRPFFGMVLPSTGRIRAFSLIPMDSGFVMQMPSPKNPSVPAPYLSRPKHLSVFNESQEWCRILDTTCAEDLNRLQREGKFREFIRVNEALHDKSIAAIADEIHANGRRCIFVAGPSSSGKTTFSNRLAVHLRVLGHRPLVVSMDDFFLNRDTYPVREDGTADFEDIVCLDMPCFEKSMKQLLRCEETDLPKYDFHTGTRSKETHTVKLNAGDPVIVEGIHALNPIVSRGIDSKWVFKVYVSCLSCVNVDDENRVRTTDVRLLRRSVRDMLFRNTPPEQTMAGWQSVRAGEEKWIFPYQETADAMFNTSLHYELPFLKKHISKNLASISPDDPNFVYVCRLKRILDSFDSLTEDVYNEVPPLSLMREFLGGCTFYV